MKKTTALICIAVLLVILFSACRTSKKIELSKPQTNISSIEIIHIHSGSAKALETGYWEVPFEYDLLNTIPEARWNIFMGELRGIEWYERLLQGEPPAVGGDAVKINYNDGSCETICCMASESYKDGESTLNYIACDEKVFESFIEKYAEK